MGMYIYTIRPTRPEMLKSGPDEHEIAAFQAHSAYLKELASNGTLLVSGRSAGEDSVGLAIYYANDDDQAERIAKSDPFVSRGVVIATVRQFLPAAGTAFSDSRQGA